VYERVREMRERERENFLTPIHLFSTNNLVRGMIDSMIVVLTY
jgi:hypothetical protein